MSSSVKFTPGMLAFRRAVMGGRKIEPNVDMASLPVVLWRKGGQSSISSVLFEVVDSGMIRIL